MDQSAIYPVEKLAPTLSVVLSPRWHRKGTHQKASKNGGLQLQIGWPRAFRIRKATTAVWNVQILEDPIGARQFEIVRIGSRPDDDERVEYGGSRV